jgi:hypothetical protein
MQKKAWVAGSSPAKANWCVLQSLADADPTLMVEPRVPGLFTALPDTIEKPNYWPSNATFRSGMSHA